MAGGSPEDPLRAIWERHRPNVLARVELIERAAAALSAGELGEQLREEAQHTAHTLIGSVGTLGFAGASRAARELERKLADDPTAADAPDIRALVATVRLDLQDEARPRSRLRRARGG
jgi:HPt (histidine-containing phosphotransfer) domain-containing protein